MIELLREIFSMSFDIIIPLSFCLIAFGLAVVLFGIRYLSYMKVRRKFKDTEPQTQDPVILAMEAMEAKAAGDSEE